MVLVSATVVFGSFLAIDFVNLCQKRTVESTLAATLTITWKIPIADV